MPKAAELLAARIRGQIIRGELKEGDALPAESELMETFGVSRPTLREAIRVLEMESLLRMRRGRAAARWSPRRIRGWPRAPSACSCSSVG